MLLDAVVRVWHPLLSVSAIQTLVGKMPEVSHGVGERRTHGDRSAYKESYCEFRVLGKDKRPIGPAVDDCVRLLSTMSKADPSFFSGGGHAAVVIGIFESEFLQIDLDISEIARLHHSNAALVIENRS